MTVARRPGRTSRRSKPDRAEFIGRGRNAWPTRRRWTRRPAVRQRGPGARSGRRHPPHGQSCRPTRRSRSTSSPASPRRARPRSALMDKYHDRQLARPRLRAGLDPQPGRAAAAERHRGRRPAVRPAGRLGDLRQPACAAPPQHLGAQPQRPVGALGLRDLGRPADRPGPHRATGERWTWCARLVQAHAYWRHEGAQRGPGHLERGPSGYRQTLQDADHGR